MFNRISPRSFAGVRYLLFVGIAAAIGWPAAAVAADTPFRDLLGRVPREANAVMLLNLDKIKASELGQQENWEENIEKAFEQGVTRVPPQATQLVLAAQFDWEFMEPMWEATVMNVSIPVSIERIATRYHGIIDSLEGRPAARLSSDVYVLRLAEQTVGVLSPANRQSAIRWMREIQKPSADRLSPYLQKAAGYSDDAGTEIIMAADFEGLYSADVLLKYLEGKRETLAGWKAEADAVAELLAGIQGVRLGVRIGEKPLGKLVIDCTTDTAFAAKFAKPLLLEILGDAGAMIADFESWKVEAKGKTISLEGTLSISALKRLASLLDSPLPDDSFAKADAKKPVGGKKPAKDPEDPISPSEPGYNTAQATLGYYKGVQRLFNELKNDMRKTVTLSQNSLWFDKSARKMERLPILGVDPDMIKYGNYVAAELRLASGSVRTMGIRGNLRQSQEITPNEAPYSYGSYRYGRYGWYGGPAVSESTYAVYDPDRAAQQIASQRRVIRAEEKGQMAGDVQTIRAEIIKATGEIRQAMTEKYQTEF